MNKSDIVNKIADKIGLTKVDASTTFDLIFETISKGAKKDKVGLVGFGTFEVKTRKARNGVNPSTGQKIRIKAKKVMTFKASKNPKFK